MFTIPAQKIIAFWAIYLQSELRVLCIASISEFFLKKLYNSGSQKDNAGGISQQLSQATDDIYIIIRELTFGLPPPLIQLFIAIWTILCSVMRFSPRSLCGEKVKVSERHSYTGIIGSSRFIISRGPFVFTVNSFIKQIVNPHICTQVFVNIVIDV